MQVHPHLDITDPRGGGRFVRLSWHLERRAIIVSHWRDGLCVSTTTVGPEHFGDIVGFVAKALGDLALQGGRTGADDSPPPGGRRLGERARSWLRPRLGTVLALAKHQVLDHPSSRRSA